MATNKDILSNSEAAASSVIQKLLVRDLPSIQQNRSTSKSPMIVEVPLIKSGVSIRSNGSQAAKQNNAHVKTQNPEITKWVNTMLLFVLFPPVFA